MKQGERDQLQVAQVKRLDRIARAAERREAREREVERNASYPPLRRLFGGEQGAVTLIRSIPGFAAHWEKIVPDSYVRETRARDGQRWRVVACPCGEHPALTAGALADCFCGRWYFDVGKTIRVHRFVTEPDPVAA